MIRVVIGANDVTPEVEMIIGFDKTEDFDFGSFTLKNTTKEEMYKFGEDVRIEIGTKTYRYIVETDKRTKVADGIYDHLITLTEHTAKLTKILYADRLFTVKSSGVAYSLFEMANIIRLTEPFNGTPYFTIASSTVLALDVEGKQLKMQTQNTYEKLNKIFKGIKAVPRMNYLNEVTHVLYNSVNNPITLNSVIGDNKQRNANDYGDTIVSKSRNVAFDGGKFGDDVLVFPAIGQGVSVRGSKGDYTDETAEWQLPFGIREIVKVVLYDVQTVSSGNITLDITNYVRDKEDFDGLPLGDPTNIQLNGEPVQRNCIYYTKGDTKIINMATEVQATTKRSTFENLVQNALEAAAPAGGAQFVAQPLWEYKINVEYLPYVDADITRTRYNNDIDKRGEILSQQRETVLDFKRHAAVLNDTAIRKSNGNWILTVVHESIEDCFEVGDYTSDNYQVIKASYTILSETQIEGFYELSKYWSTVNAEESTNREPQPYTLARESMDAKFRITEYIEFSTTNALDTGSLTLQGFKTLLNLFDYDANDNIPVRLAQYSSADSSVGTGGAINVSTYGKATDGGLNIFMEFNERKLAGNILDLVGDNEIQPVNYTNDGGGVDLFSVQYVNNTTISTNNYPIGAKEPNPLINITNIPVYKDPNEILKLNYELLWASDEPEKIIIGEQFNVYNYLVHGLTRQDVNLAVYTIDPSVVIDDMTKIIPSYLTKTVNTSGQIVVNKSATNPYIDVSGVTGTDTNTWAIGFAVDDSLVMAVNYDGTNSTRIYFNNLKDLRERL